MRKHRHPNIKSAVVTHRNHSEIREKIRTLDDIDDRGRKAAVATAVLQKEQPKEIACDFEQRDTAQVTDGNPIDNSRKTGINANVYYRYAMSDGTEAEIRTERRKVVGLEGGDDDSSVSARE